MKREEYNAVISTKLKPKQADELKNRCNFGNISQSSFVREAILEKMNSNHPSNIAGKNKIEYDSKKDTFAWKIELDNGEEHIVLENLSPEFIQDLSQNLNFELNKRKEIIGKNGKKSVAVPRRILKK